MQKEMHLWGIRFFRVLLAVLPRVMESLLRRADRDPYYRKIVVVQRPVEREIAASALLSNSTTLTAS
jgi:hypothetical protein